MSENLNKETGCVFLFSLRMASVFFNHITGGACPAIKAPNWEEEIQTRERSI